MEIIVAADGAPRVVTRRSRIASYAHFWTRAAGGRRAFDGVEASAVIE